MQYMYIIRLSMYDIYAYIYTYIFKVRYVSTCISMCFFSFLNLTQNYQACVPGMFFFKNGSELWIFS